MVFKKRDVGGDGMTKHELLVISAYTSYLFCEVDELHKFIEETLARPVLTHELSKKRNLGKITR